MSETRNLTDPYHGIACPKCHGPTRVIDSRLVPDTNRIRRRRRCDKCAFRFSTRERIVGETDTLAEVEAALHTLENQLRELVTKIHDLRN